MAIWEEIIGKLIGNISLDISRQMYLGPIAQSVHKLIIQILLKYALVLRGKNLSDHFTILYMRRQLSCRGMCKIVTWLDY